jgi:hypothetical protein
VCRAEVIGSLLRPAYPKEARAAFERGELSAHDFKRVEDRAVDQVIAMQEGSADGEMRRYLFMARSPRRWTDRAGGRGQPDAVDEPGRGARVVGSGRGYLEAPEAALTGH